MGADPPTELADFTPPLAAAVARTLREHGVAAQVDATEPARVLVPGSQRDEAVALMAAHMEQIRARVRPEDERGAAGAAQAASPPSATGPTPHREPGVEAEAATRPLLTERLRRLWPLALLLIPLVGLLGPTRVPADLALLVLVGGMALVLMLRQRRRR